MSTPVQLTDPERFFLEPTHARHRQYEALRAYFVEHRTNPLLLESGVLKKPIAIPGWGGASLEIVFP